MTNTRFWRPGWFLGLVIALLSLMTNSSTFAQSPGRWAYDDGVGTTDSGPSPHVAPSGNDDQSMASNSPKGEVGRPGQPVSVAARFVVPAYGQSPLRETLMVMLYNLAFESECKLRHQHGRYSRCAIPGRVT
jgi:hypothetical protein